MSSNNYSYHTDWDAIYRDTNTSTPWIGAEVSDYLKNVFGNASYVRTHKKDSIIDIGCGDGTFCNFLAEKGYTNIKGIDTSSVIIGRCKETNYSNHIIFERRDIISDCFSPEEQYNIVVCWLVLHHIRKEDLQHFALNITSLCKTGGEIYLSVLLPEQKGQRDRASLFSDKHRVMYYSPDEITELFSPFFKSVEYVGENLICKKISGDSFKYYILKLGHAIFSQEIWENRIDSFRKSITIESRATITNMIQLLNLFAVDTRNNAKTLSETVFSRLYTDLFCNISRFLCKRILLYRTSCEDVVILKIDVKEKATIYSATKYYEQDKRIHCRYGVAEGDSVNSRAYDLFLLYNEHIKKYSPERRYTLHQHFQEKPDLKYILFDKDSISSPDCYPKVVSDISEYPEYEQFLSSLFHALSEEDKGVVAFLENSDNALSLDGFVATSFSCFNLGIIGFESWGTLMIESRRPKDDIKGLFFDRKNNETNLLLDIKNVFFILKKIAYDYYDILNTNAIKIQATKAAIAQVMARNMSHNMGSHVFSNLIDSRVGERISDPDTTDPNELNNLPYYPLYLSRAIDTPQLALFNQYMKSRMDYLSEVTLGISDLATTRKLYGDVMMGLDRTRILLNYISGVKNFKYEFKLLWYDTPLEKNDVGASFPGDVLGCQAFYNILENVIRNTAKHHAGSNSDKRIHFTIRIKDACDLYCVEVDDGLPLEDVKLISKQNHRFNMSVLDENNNLRSKALGLLEMKSSAAFLRQISLEDIDSEDYQIDLNDAPKEDFEGNGRKRMSIIEAFGATIANSSDTALGYRFFLQKPKEFLFVGEHFTSVVNAEEQQRLNRLGIGFSSLEAFKSSMKAEVAYPHQFLIYDDSSTSDVLSCNRSLLPLRLLYDTSGQFFNLLRDKKDPDELLGCLKEYAWDGVVPGNVSIEGEFKPSLSNYVIFTHHKGSYPQYYKQLFSDDKDEIHESGINGNGVWVENLTSWTKGKMPNFASIASPGNNELSSYVRNAKSARPLLKAIYEAYQTRVIIIDERIQKYAEENEEDSIPCWELFRSTNVYIPRRPMKEKGKYVAPKGVDQSGKSFIIKHTNANVIPLAPKSFGNYKTKLENYIKAYLNEDSFLIIHYGILERMYNREESIITEKLEKWARCAKRVVVTSGRGSHSLNLPNSVCFANLSSVLYACNENRNKYLINYLINQSRRNRK